MPQCPHPAFAPTFALMPPSTILCANAHVAPWLATTSHARRQTSVTRVSRTAATPPNPSASASPRRCCHRPPRALHGLQSDSLLRMSITHSHASLLLLPTRHPRLHALSLFASMCHLSARYRHLVCTRPTPPPRTCSYTLFLFFLVLDVKLIISKYM